MYSSPGISIAPIYYGLKKSGQDPRNRSGFWPGKEAMRECFRTYTVGAPVEKAFSQRQAGLSEGNGKEPWHPQQVRRGILYLLSSVWSAVSPRSRDRRHNMARCPGCRPSDGRWLDCGAVGARGGAPRPRPRTRPEAGGWESRGSRLRMLCVQRGRPGPLSLCRRRLQPSVTLPSG